MNAYNTKIIILIFTTLLSSLPTITFSQTKRVISFKFTEKDFTIEKTDDGYTRILSDDRNALIWGDSIDPALPFFNFTILVSPNEIYQSHKLSYEKILIASDVDIEPNPSPISDCLNRSSVSESLIKTNYLGDSYPKEQAAYTGTNIMDGYKLLNFVVCPFHYDISNRKLYLIRGIKVNIETTEKHAVVLTERQNTGNNMRNTIINIVENSNEIDKLYPNTKNEHKYESKTHQSVPYKYIIVTCDSLHDVFDKLARWKTIKGVKTKVVTIEECCQEFPEYTQQLAIKSVLSNYYSNGMEYALLGGDVNIIPAQMCDLPHYDETTDTPADLYYSCLDNDISWDTNGDHIYAGAQDIVDLAPEFIITRASVNSRSDAEIFVNRIIEYESNPKLQNWNNSILMCGYYRHQYREKNGMIISDAQYDSEANYENYIQPYWNGGKFELFDTWSDYPNDRNNASREAFQHELTKGYTFVDEYSHGFVNRWGWLANDSCYHDVHASNLENNGYSIITTISCHSNAFDKVSSDYPREDFYYDKSLSEAFMRNPKSGILAYWGSSREGWANYTKNFIGKFYEFLLTGDDKQFGRATVASKNYFLGSASNYSSYYRRLILSLNALGDAEMPVYTEVPRIFENINISFSRGVLNISSNVNNCTICVSSVNDYGETYYHVINNTDSTVINGLDNDYYLCITKPGYIPYLARVGSNVCIQNEIISRDLPIFSDVTQIGRNIISDRSEGDVILTKGKIKNVSHEYFLINNGFKTENGTEIFINNP